MKTYLIETPSSYTVLPALKKLLVDHPDILIYTGKLRYDTVNGIPQMGDVDNYPLILYGTENKAEIRICIFMLAAGYGGTGPHDLADVLNFFRLKFEPNWIFTKEKLNCNTNLIELNFCK